MITITQSCSCGAKFSYSGSDIYGKSLRAAFADEHKVCRERIRPTLLWGGDQA